LHGPRGWGGGLGCCVKVALALGLNDFLRLLPVVSRGREFFFKRSHLLSCELSGRLVFYLYAFFGQGLDHPVHSNVQVFGRLL